MGRFILVVSKERLEAEAALSKVRAKYRFGVGIILAFSLLAIWIILHS